MNRAIKSAQELSGNRSRKSGDRPGCVEKINAKSSPMQTNQTSFIPVKQQISQTTSLDKPAASTAPVKNISQPLHNEFASTLSESSDDETSDFFTAVNESSCSSSNTRQRWDLASFVFPDNNLPQSWLDIMETNKNMKPFDNLHKKIVNTKSSAKLIKVNKIPVDQPSTSKSLIPVPPPPPRVVETVHTESTEENMDHEMSLMPELTLSIPENLSEYMEFAPSNFGKEIPSHAPKIEPYDPQITEQLPKLAKEVEVTSSSSKGNVGKANKGKVSVGKKPETEIQLRIIETRRTRKLGISSKSKPTPTLAPIFKVPAIAANCKSMKRKSSSVVQQQQQTLINKRIRAQISMMQREAKKKTPDIEFLRRKMCLEETFKYRMAKFMQDEHSIEDLLKEFPALKIISIVMDEFERVVEITNPMVRCNPINFLENALKKRFQRVVSKIRNLPNQMPLIFCALRKLDKDSGNERLKQVVSAVSMIMNFSTDKSISSVIALKKEKESFVYRNIGLPKMVLKEQFILDEQTVIQVYLEGQEIFQVGNIYEGLIAIFAISHVFNLDYDPKIEPLMRYFEYLVDIPQVHYQEEDPLPSDDEN